MSQKSFLLEGNFDDIFLENVDDIFWGNFDDISREFVHFYWLKQICFLKITLYLLNIKYGIFYYTATKYTTLQTLLRLLVVISR